MNTLTVHKATAVHESNRFFSGNESTGPYHVKSIIVFTDDGNSVEITLFSDIRIETEVHK